MAELTGCHILVVEDEYLLAADLRIEFESLGMVVIGPEPSVDRALQRVAGEPRIDAAVLDVNLGGETAFPIADALLERQVPFLFLSGYEDSMTRTRYPGIVTCDKPLTMRSFLSAVRTLVPER